MRLLYSLMLYLLIPWLYFRLWWKGRSLPAYRLRIQERFSVNTDVIENLDVWVHAVSLGEVIAASPLIEQMLRRNWRVLVTTMTPTGSAQVQASFASRVYHRYLPYDLPFAVRRFFQQTRPKLGIILETELWPNLIAQAHSQRIPMLLVNARLSEKSCRGYQKISYLLSPLLHKFTAIYAQTKEDAERFCQIGAPKERVKLGGNLKFDLQIQASNRTKIAPLAELWGSDRVTVILASTHENEEEQILNCWRKIQKSIPQILLLIAPRHPERFEAVYALANRCGFATGLRTDLSSINRDKEIVVINSLGELLAFFAMSSFAFIGGSLIPQGGHNVLEPIVLKVPVLSGKHVHNFSDICAQLVKIQGIMMVEDAGSLVDSILFLHNNPAAKQKMVENASLMLANNQGAVSRLVHEIAELLSSPACLLKPNAQTS